VIDALSLVALALSMGGAPEPGKDIHTDYIRAASTKAAYSFECGKTRTLLRVAEEIRPRANPESSRIDGASGCWSWT
jgi:hypothetical protein